MTYIDYDGLTVEIKTRMHAAVDAVDMLDAASVDAYYEQMNGLYEQMKALRVLHEEHPPDIQADDAATVAILADSENSDAGADDPDIQDGASASCGPLDVKLKGGIIRMSDDPDDTAFLPEQVLRDIGAEHGDIIRVEPVGGGRHDYEVVEKQAMPIPYPLVQIDRTVAEFDDTLGMLVVRSYISNAGRSTIKDSNDAPAIYKLHREDVERMHIEAGDILDISFYADNPSRVARVRWKHDTMVDAVLAPKKSGYYKEKDTSGPSDVEPVFADKSISIFGATSHWQAYMDEVEKRGGVLETAQTTDTDRIAHVVKRSDVVILPIFEASHLMCEQAKAAAKAHDVPFGILDAAGRTRFVRKVKEMLD